MIPINETQLWLLLCDSDGERRAGGDGMRKIMIRRRVLLCLMVILGMATTAPTSVTQPGQSPTEPRQPSQQSADKQEGELIKLEASLVLLDALVVNKKTQTPVGDLAREDFLLTEDGVLQQISHFSRDLLPLSVLLLIDVSGSVLPFIDDIHRAALEALARLKEDDEVALMAFATRARLIVGFTKDHDLVAQKIKEVENVNDIGRATYINNAMYEAAEYMLSATRQTDRRVIIAISDNIDTSLPFRGHSQSEALDRLYESGITVCGIFVSSRFNKVMGTYAKFNPALFLMRRLSGAGSFKGYADKTGGTVVSAGREEIHNAFTTLIDLLRARYTIGYYPSHSTSDARFRRIKLQLTKPAQQRVGEVAVRTRQGYYAKKEKTE